MWVLADEGSIHQSLRMFKNQLPLCTCKVGAKLSEGPAIKPLKASFEVEGHILLRTSSSSCDKGGRFQISATGA